MIQAYQILIYLFNPIQTGLLQFDVSVRGTWGGEGGGPGGSKVNKKEKIYTNCTNGLLFVGHCMISQSE